MPQLSYIEKNRGKITSTKLNDFRKCPYLYKLKWVDEKSVQEDSDALVLGAAFDLYMRDKEEFATEYTIVSKRMGKSETIELTQKMGETIRQCELEFQRQPLYNPQGIVQHEIEIMYKGHAVKGTLDEFQPQNKLIIDDKTAASMNTFREWAHKYKMQMAFYNWLVEVKEGIAGTSALLRVVTKETPARSKFFFIPAQALEENRAFILESIDQMIEAIEENRFPFTQNKLECSSCPAWNICPNTIQTEADIEVL